VKVIEVDEHVWRHIRHQVICPERIAPLYFRAVSREFTPMPLYAATRRSFACAEPKFPVSEICTGLHESRRT
jgi:hypothetical protein